jgi:hypothetical protein
MKCIFLMKFHWISKKGPLNEVNALNKRAGEHLMMSINFFFVNNFIINVLLLINKSFDNQTER